MCIRDRQSDLVEAIARTGAVINVKKPQFLAPHEMRHIITKCGEAGNNRVLLCCLLYTSRCV